MSPEQKALVRQTWQQLVPVAEGAVQLFYDRLFAIDPSIRPLFKGDLVGQRQKLIQALALVVRGLDQVETLLPALAALGRRHVEYGVEDRHYDTVGAALLWTLEQALGSAWTPEVKAAWHNAYSLLAEVMRGAASEVEPARRRCA